MDGGSSGSSLSTRRLSLVHPRHLRVTQFRIMSDPVTLSDAGIRRRIGPWNPDSLPSLDAFEPDRNFLVRAAAGSGKTTALVARMVGLVRTGVPIHHCTAITFTRKAASEMKARLYRELRMAEQRLRQGPEGSREERDRVRQALSNLSRCFIGTIHSFCSRLLRERPLAAGLPPNFTAGLDDRDRQDLRRRVWHSYLSDIWAEAPDRVEHVASLGIEPTELEHFFGRLCHYPDLTPYVDGPSSPPDLDTAVEALRAFVKEWSEFLPDDPADGDAKPGTTADAFRDAQRFLNYRSLNDPSTKAEFVEIFDGVTKKDGRKTTDTEVRGDLTKSHWLDAGVADRLDNELLPRLKEDVVAPALRSWKSYVHRQLVEFVVPAVERYETLRRETGQLTFQDLLVCARDLLRDDPEARHALQQRYPRLLVDEFQDTDPIQAELLFYLASDNPTEQNWRECSPRDGSLFIVGDGKQSIYRFRRADLDIYRAVRDAIDDATNGEDLTLQSNFRSVAPVLDWCNDTFSALFETVDDSYQAPYVSFDPARSESLSSTAVRELHVPYVKGSSYPRDVGQRNAEQVAAYIAATCAQDDPLLRDQEGTPIVHGEPGDFMILTRTTTRLDEFAEALAERGIPYTLTGGDDVEASSELYALLTLLTCVERPQDPVARLAYLRGPLVGLSDDALYRFRTCGGTFEGSFELSAEVSKGLDEDLTNLLVTAYSHLRQAQNWLNQLRPASAIERLVDMLGLMPRTRRESGLGSLHAGRLLRVLTEVQRLDAKGHTWTSIRSELQQVLDGDRDLDGMTLEKGSGDAVRLLNVHKAKGLEAPVVILADPYGGKHPKDPDEHVRRNEGEVVLPVYENHRYTRTLRYAPERWETEFKEIEAKYQEAEEHRLLYVAATRAESLLVVCCYQPDRWNEDKGYWAPLFPHLEDCPQIEVPEDVQTTLSPPPEDTVPEPLSSGRREKVAVPSYTSQTVTGEADDTELPAVSGGYGRDLGNAMHELFAFVAQRRKAFEKAKLPDRIFETILEKHEVTLHRPIAQQMMNAFFDSPLWKSIRSAEIVHAELPVSGLRSEETSSPEVLDGTIDLLYRVNGDWHLIDYKTDRVSDNRESLVDHYRPQIESYAQLWTAATGADITQKGLWLADLGTHVPV